MAVRIVTDSVADIPPQVAQELKVAVVPLNVRFGTDVYRDRIDLTSERFYQKLVNSGTLPVTSVPTPQTFADTYDQLAEEADEILVITLSSKLSATYEVALQSIGLMKQKCRVEVVDSKWAVMAQGFLVLAAARAAQVGAGLDEIMDIVRQNTHHVDFRAAFNTLEYLKRGGRIGMAQAFLGSVLKINPLITLRNGVVVPAGKTRSRHQAIGQLHDFVLSFSHIEEMAVEDAACPDAAESLVERLGSTFPKERIYRSGMTPVIGAHTGPGLLLVAVLGDR